MLIRKFLQKIKYFCLILDLFALLFGKLKTMSSDKQNAFFSLIFYAFSRFMFVVRPLLCFYQNIKQLAYYQIENFPSRHAYYVAMSKFDSMSFRLKRLNKNIRCTSNTNSRSEHSLSTYTRAQNI